VGAEGERAPARPAKSPSAFRTIGEVAQDLDLPAHVLRFWESKFPQLRPLKRGGGRRYYRPEDIILLRWIKRCLYHDGYTIRGVQQLLGTAIAEPAVTPEPAAAPSLFPLEPIEPEAPPRRTRRRTLTPELRMALEEIRRELQEARTLLEELLGKTKRE